MYLFEIKIIVWDEFALNCVQDQRSRKYLISLLCPNIFKLNYYCYYYEIFIYIFIFERESKCNIVKKLIFLEDIFFSFTVTIISNTKNVMYTFVCQKS